MIPVCIHFDPEQRKTSCKLGNGRIVPRDCPCNAYKDDPGYNNRTLDIDKRRDADWAAAHTQFKAFGV